MTTTLKRRLRSIRKSKTRKRPYTKKDYNSGDGMLTAVWGPSLWHYLHIQSFNYPIKPSIKDKKHYRQFITNLQYVLPCKYCRVNLKNNLKSYPLTNQHLKNRESFSKYIFNLHEIINKMLNKKSGLTYSEVRTRYEHFRSRCTDEIKLFNVKKPRKSKSRITRKHKKSKERGCTEPLYGKKSKCVIKIVPQEEKCNTFQMDKKCIKKR